MISWDRTVWTGHRKKTSLFRKLNLNTVFSHMQHLQCEGWWNRCKLTGFLSSLCCQLVYNFIKNCWMLFILFPLFISANFSVFWSKMKNCWQLEYLQHNGLYWIKDSQKSCVLCSCLWMRPMHCLRLQCWSSQTKGCWAGARPLVGARQSFWGQIEEVKVVRESKGGAACTSPAPQRSSTAVTLFSDDFLFWRPSSEVLSCQRLMLCHPH